MDVRAPDSADDGAKVVAGLVQVAVAEAEKEVGLVCDAVGSSQDEPGNIRY